MWRRLLLNVINTTVVQKFTSADDRQHMDSFIRRIVRQGYCASDSDIDGMIDQADAKLLQLVLTNANHVLSSLLPDKTDQHQSKAPRQTTC